jgi:hypothetical protein
VVGVIEGLQLKTMFSWSTNPPLQRDSEEQTTDPVSQNLGTASDVSEARNRSDSIEREVFAFEESDTRCRRTRKVIGFHI